MQIRQLEALQNMARTAGAKVVFGESSRRFLPFNCSESSVSVFHFLPLLTPISVPMNLGTMGAGGMDNVAQQISASARFEDGSGSASNAGLISSMANV